MFNHQFPDNKHYPYFRMMKLPNILLSLSLILTASLANAQQFKVIKDTVDYKLMDVDSGYFYSHGIEAKKQLLVGGGSIKTSGDILKKRRGTYKIHLDNGKTLVLKDSTYKKGQYYELRYYFIKDDMWDYGENKRDGYYLFDKLVYQNKWSYLLVNKNNGIIDTLNGKPFFSPNCKVYAYNHKDHSSNVSIIKFKNLLTGQVSSFELGIEIPFPIRSISNFKWIDDYSLMFCTVPNGMHRYNMHEEKYYLLQIKH